MVRAHSLRSAKIPLLPFVLFSFALLDTTGCNSNRDSTPPSPSTPAAQSIQGHVYGGQQPVAGATIQLYAAGTPSSGGDYGQGATPLITGTLPTTDSNGYFTITGLYTPPSTPSYFYIVATGGSPGNGNPVNPHIVMMAVIGGCTANSTLSSSLFIVINEVTTMAAVMALQPVSSQQFVAAPTGIAGASVLIGAPASNYNDLRTAFNTASTLVGISSGAAAGPASSNGELLNTLADILAYCVNSDPSSSSNCSTLFAAATPSGQTTAADTLQAAWYIAQNPTNSVSALFGLIPPSPPFVALSSAPASFAVTVPPTALVACFAILGNTTVTNTGPTVVTGGDLGLYPGTSVTGFPPGIVTSPATQHITDSIAANAQNNLTGAYNYAAGLTGTGSLPPDMGGSTFVPGAYTNSGAVALSTNVTLDAQGDENAVFVFQIGSTLTTSSGTVISLVNSAQAQNVFWQVGASATIGSSSTFQGTIMAHVSITANTGAGINGRALANGGAVTLDSNVVTVP